MLDEFHLANTLLVAALPHIYDHVDDILNEWRWKHALTFKEAEQVLSEAESRCKASALLSSVSLVEKLMRNILITRAFVNAVYGSNWAHYAAALYQLYGGGKARVLDL